MAVARAYYRRPGGAVSPSSFSLPLASCRVTGSGLRARHKGGQILILLVEDSADDAALITRTLSKGGVRNPIPVAANGEEAKAYLAGQRQYANRKRYPMPGLVLLDLTLPGVDGFEVLRWMRGQPTLNKLRVVVLTGSTDIRDANRAYELGANSFLVKPLEFGNAVQIGAWLKDNWLPEEKEPSAQLQKPTTAPGKSLPRPGAKRPGLGHDPRSLPGARRS